MKRIHHIHSFAPGNPKVYNKLATFFIVFWLLFGLAGIAFAFYMIYSAL